METSIKLTVYYEQPIWVGVLERVGEGHLETCRIVFGPEPKDAAVHDLLLRNWRELQFGPPVKHAIPSQRVANPKRLQRQVKRDLQQAGVGTKAQEAIKLAYTENKRVRRCEAEGRREEQTEHKFALRQAKKLSKRRGR